jgi:hypothetical protein
MPRFLSGLKQEAPEEKDAQDKDERDNDNLNQAHNSFLRYQDRETATRRVERALF